MNRKGYEEDMKKGCKEGYEGGRCTLFSRGRPWQLAPGRSVGILWTAAEQAPFPSSPFISLLIFSSHPLLHILFISPHIPFISSSYLSHILILSFCMLYHLEQ